MRLVSVFGRISSWFGLVLFVSGFIQLTSCASKVGLCDHIHMEEGHLDLDANERILICGKGGKVEAWNSVPIPQAEYQVKVLLQNEGYLNPHFERRQDDLYVWSGPRELTRELKINGAIGLLKAGKKREIVGEPMTPEKLDEVKRWAETQVQEHGYACPTIAVHGQAWDHTMVVDVDTGPRSRIAGIDYSGLGSLDTESLARHQAMQPGDWFDVRETQLTAGRMLNDALFQTAYFTNDCRGDLVDLHLMTAVGKPRILRFGVGASTEEFPFTQIWFKNARLDNRASSFTTTLYASPKRQSLDAGAEYYRVPWSKRSYLGPRFLVSRQKESTYEVNRAQVGGDLGRLWDIWKLRMQARFGPTLNYVNTVRGVGPQNLSFLSWEGSFLSTSRDYELFTRDQYDGWQGGFEYRGQRKGIGSPVNVDRYEVNLKNLWNVGHLFPPLFVLGARAQGVAVNASATDISKGKENELLPIDYRLFYGGDDNLRGFNRQALNNHELGYLSALYFGLELRLIEELPYHFEPFLLLDTAKLGDRRFTLDRSIFISEGAGVRWPSPFGTLRGSIAKGRILNQQAALPVYPQEWVTFVSFGKEF